jgi:hypothetical protein
VATLRCILILSVVSVSLLAAEQATNESVVKMVNAGVGEDAVISVVTNSDSAFSLSATDLIALKQAGVSDRIVSSMIAKTTRIGARSRAGLDTNDVMTSPRQLPTHETAIHLTVQHDIRSGEAQVGDQVRFLVADEVVISGTTVIQRGATAIGSVVKAQAHRRLGRGGGLMIVADSLLLPDGTRTKLRGAMATTGSNRTKVMVVAGGVTGFIAWPAAPVLLLLPGKDAMIPKGTEVVAYLVDRELYAAF